MALQNLGFELLPLIAGLGVAGAGIALATPGVLCIVVSRLTIIFTKPYSVGENIAIGGIEGEVNAITLINTAITHADRSVMNGHFLSAQWTNERRQVRVEISDYGATEGELYLALVPELRRRGIVLPFPLHEVRLLGSA